MNKMEEKKMDNPICPKCNTEMYERGLKLYPDRIWVYSRIFGNMLGEVPQSGDIVFACEKCGTNEKVPVKISVDRMGAE